MLGATSSQPTVPPHKLPPARLVIHRQTSAHEQRKGTREGSDEVGHISVFLPPASLKIGLWSSSTLSTRVTRKLMLGREVATLAVHRVSGSEPLSGRRMDIVIGHGRSGVPYVVEYQAPSVTLTLREDWLCKRVLETPCHAWITTSPQDPTAMSPDRWSKFTWDTVSAVGYDLWIQ